jgi:hypothetical protein
MNDWDPFAPEAETEQRLESAVCNGIEIKPGDRVRLHPLGRADIFDLALNGKIATIVSIEQDFEDRIHVSVAVEDDPGQDYGLQGKPGHRFFFGIDEIEPLSNKPAQK